MASRKIYQALRTNRKCKSVDLIQKYIDDHNFQTWHIECRKCLPLQNRKGHFKALDKSTWANFSWFGFLFCPDRTPEAIILYTYLIKE